jgi:hypothetical protein
MSIYTDMQEIIKERGIGTKHMINGSGNCCLLGAKCLALGYTPDQIINMETGDPDTDYYFYSAEEIPELVLVISQVYNKGNTNASKVYFYNDHVIAGSTEKALDILSKAEAILREKVSV